MSCPQDENSEKDSAEFARFFTTAEAVILVQASRLLGVHVSPAEVSKGLAAHPAAEPLERLSLVAPAAGLKIDPVRLPLAEALWLARSSLPLLVRSRQHGWCVLVSGGLFRCRLCALDGSGATITLSRVRLLSQLGLVSPHEIVEVGFGSVAMAMQDLKHPPGAHPDHPAPVKRLVALMRPELPDIIAILIFSLVTGVLYLAFPLAVNGLVTNLAFGSQSTPYQQALLFIASALTGCLLISGILRGLQYLVSEQIQRRIFVRLAADMAYRLPRVRTAVLDGIHAPELVNRFLDVVTVQKSSATLLLNGINIIVGALIGLLVLGFYHPFLLVYMLLVLSALGFIIFVLGRGAVASSLAESRRKYEVVGWLEEVACYPRLFKGPAGSGLSLSRTDDFARQYLDARAWHFRILFRQIIGLLTLEVIAAAGLLIVGGGLVLNQQLTLGQLVASELIVSAVVASVAKLGKQFESWYDALAAVDKIGYLVDLDTEPEGGEVPVASPQGMALQLKDVSFRYADGPLILHQVNLTVSPGQRLVFTGSQGSGCSTLLDLVAGMREPTQGSILAEGLDLRSWDKNVYRSQVMVLRTQDIITASLADNIRLGRAEISSVDIQHALAEVGLLAEVLALPQGLETPLVTGGLPLSSRQRNRLLLARALVLRPQLLVIDELFDGMESAQHRQLTDLIMNPTRPWTVLLATRDPQLAARCPTVFTLPSVSA